MKRTGQTVLTKRRGLQGIAAVGLSHFLPGCKPVSEGIAREMLPREPGKSSKPSLAAAKDSIRLTAAPGRVRLVPDDRPETPVWAYEGKVPGKPIRAKRGDTINVDFRNALPEPTTVHWHGLRLDNAMDGVPFLTQKPVRPGERFRYDLRLPDAGTFWYHPHLGTEVQVARGLYGPLIVEESTEPAVDRDLVWVIDDWRLDGQARIIEDFNRWFDVAFDGRIGNTVTINGMEHYREPVQQGERLRLRLVNAANARLISLNFGPHPVWIVALDGQPLPTPMRLSESDNVFLGPGQRADIVIDMTAPDGKLFHVLDRLRPDRPYPVGSFEYQGRIASPNRSSRPAPDSLEPNALPEPTRTDVLDARIVMEGGMMHGRRGGRGQRGQASSGAPTAWWLNGEAHSSHGPDHPFAFEAEAGRTVRLVYENRSTKWHPMHLHGHHFRELTRNGRPVPMTPWRDTTMVAPRETLAVSFVADNPGDWLIHCHILEHHAGGMGTQFRVRA